jgi:tetratricopeptide (TPR) repeat protein
VDQAKSPTVPSSTVPGSAVPSAEPVLDRALFRSPASLALLLFLATLIVYIPAFTGGFINYDDPAYVTSNAHVLQGLSWTNIAWAFTTTVEANWHPLTWISHMADIELFGVNPRGPHVVNVLFHAVNVVLLFFVLLRATGYLLRSAVVAALFAVHPLNVECVAWISERKSLLSMMFLLLALIVYDWYATDRTVGRYATVAGILALGLMAKPMVVTLPVLLLLWDYWPLARDVNDAQNRPAFLQLFAEKIPLFLLSAASSGITIYAQRSGGALGSAELLPFTLRLENAVYSYVAYIGKGIWPARLAVFYPHPEGSLAIWKVVAAALLIVAITALAWLQRSRRRYLLAGWLWYLAAMLPMIGLVQAGLQARADRYAYLPFIGLFIIAVWGCAELFAALKLPRSAEMLIAAAVMVAYASVAFVQVRYWHDSYALFTHALGVTSRNGVAEDNLGVALMEMGRPDEALPHFQAAAEYIPRLATAHYNVGVLLQRQNRLDDARREYGLALQYSADPRETAQAHANLGFLLLDESPAAAIPHFNAALAFNPDKQNYLFGRGVAEYRVRQFDDAVNDLAHASQIAPFAPADYWLGRAFEDKGEKESAAKAYGAALQIAPEMTEARQRLDGLRSGQSGASSGLKPGRP